ncbi:hypothetical protein [uncultured Methanobrevibacter sp.]|uniref:hypothetical protein n=1 Tax=uncultured Methanobrevibacter sp. TaxID=253161 RepID=UPI0025E0999D|nr:hypothetical protein [uncultured Methanobrevibacter sp.]
MIEIIFRSVNGHEYKDAFEHHENFSEHIFTDVKTVNCGWQPMVGHPTCTKGCDTNCKLCQILFDEIGVEY